MEKLYALRLVRTYIILFFLAFSGKSLTAQCNNADFSLGNFTGWTGTYSAGQCNGQLVDGICVCSATNPVNAIGFNQGPNNDPPGDDTTQYSHIICTVAGGNDPNLTSLGGTLPMVYPGNAYSLRMGNMWQLTSIDGIGDGETTSYSLNVTALNNRFTYYFAVLLSDGGHDTSEQAYFKVGMKDGNGNAISYAALQVNATTATTFGGFIEYSGGNAPLYVKSWTPVIIPLNNYIGQTVTITFTTRGCLPDGCAGTHYAYAYISASCGPSNLISSAPTICGGHNITLTAPEGAATYSWTGPGIVSGDTSRIVTVDQPGHYTITMTTLGSNPYTFTLDTLIPSSPLSPSADFSAPTVCIGNPTLFTDLSSQAGQITSWAWSFNNDSIIDATTQNPVYTFDSAGTYPVSLIVSNSNCNADTTINVVVTSSASSAFTATSPLCEGISTDIVYTGGTSNASIFTWNFDGGSVQSGTGEGPYQVTWSSSGPKNITLTVAEGTCTSPVSTVQVVVNPFPGLVVQPSVSVCQGESVMLTASGASTYSWSPVASLNSSNMSTVIAEPDTSTIYTVIGANAYCTVTATVSVTVNPVPTSVFTTISPVCAGQSCTVTYSGTGNNQATYMWNFEGGIATSDTGQGPEQVVWVNAGNQSISLTVVENGCNSPLTTETIVVNAVPTDSFIVISPVDTGENSTVTFTGNASNAAIYNWNFGGANVVSGTAAGPYVVNWARAGIDTITLYVTDNGCTSSIDTQLVTVNVRILAINEVINQLAVTLYPNPVLDGDVTLTAEMPQLANVNISLFDVLGRLLTEETHLFKAGINSLQLHYNSLSAGNYYMQILESASGKSSVLKLVIQ